MFHEPHPLLGATLAQTVILFCNVITFRFCFVVEVWVWGLMLWVRPFPLQVLTDASDIDIDFARALEKAELDATCQFLETDEGSFR